MYRQPSSMPATVKMPPTMAHTLVMNCRNVRRDSTITILTGANSYLTNTPASRGGDGARGRGSDGTRGRRWVAQSRARRRTWMRERAGAQLHVLVVLRERVVVAGDHAAVQEMVLHGHDLEEVLELGHWIAAGVGGGRWKAGNEQQ